MKFTTTSQITVALIAMMSGTAKAADTMTINWQNNTGTTIYLNKWSCQPSGACTFPSTIGAGQTGVLIVKPSDSNATVRQIIMEFGYFNKSFQEQTCQIHADVTKLSQGNYQAGAPYMNKTKGNPSCFVYITQKDNTSGNYSYYAAMQ